MKKGVTKKKPAKKPVRKKKAPVKRKEAPGQPTKKKSKGGRPSPFTKLSPRIPLLARRGFTDKEIAQTLGIKEQTLNNWKKRHPTFFESLNDWKHEADHKVERSLYERACGYSHPETKVFCHQGEIITCEVTKHYPPDSTAMIFWLKNRMPKEYRDKVDHDHNLPPHTKITVEYVESDKGNKKD